MSSINTPQNLFLVRAFALPVAQLYAAWTEPTLVRRWWGPRGFVCHRADMDVRPGGASLVGMRAPAEWGGKEMYNTWTYSAVDPVQRLEFILRFSDAAGTPLLPQSLGIPEGVPSEVPHTLSFRALDEAHSEITVSEFGYLSSAAMEMSRGGLIQTLDKLEEACAI